MQTSYRMQFKYRKNSTGTVKLDQIHQKSLDPIIPKPTFQAEIPNYQYGSQSTKRTFEVRPIGKSNHGPSSFFGRKKYRVRN